MRSIATATGTILCLVLALSAIADDKPPVDEKVAQHLAEMLQVGFARSPKAFQDSQRLYDSLRTESQNNPRVDYAHGLILMKLLRTKEAKADFLTAIKRPGTFYPPAWQALIWSNFAAKEFDDGYDRLAEFAKRVGDSDGLTDRERYDQAYWVGRVMAALEMGLDSNQSRESWFQTQTRMVDRLGPVLANAYDDGKEDVHAKHMVLEEDIRQAREKENDKQGKKLDEIGKSLNAADTKRENLKKSAAELKEEFEEQSTAYKKQFERMEKDYAMMERRGLSLMTQMVTFDQQINLAQNNRNPNFNTGGLAALQSRRALLDTEFQMTANATRQLAANAQQLAQQRAEFESQYEQATGNIVKEEASVKKWKERAEKHADELKKAAKKPVGPAAGLNAKIQAATSFRTYVDLDLAVERESLLRSLGVTAAK